MNNYSHLTRQLSLIPVEELKKHTIHVVGAGAIGSFTALALAKMGIEKLCVWDFDEVGVENVSCQIYGRRQLGQPKVQALAEIVGFLSETQVMPMHMRLTKQEVPTLEGIVVLAVDTMKARKEIAQAISEVGVRVRLVVDPRMGAEKYNQYTYVPHTKQFKEYLEHFMYDDKVVAEPSCTAKATVYTATLAAGMICKTVKNYIMKQPYPKTVMWDIASTCEGSLALFPEVMHD